MPISTVLKLVLRRKHVINLSHHYYTVFIPTGIEILLWCCIWSCRRCGWACPGRTGSTRPCHWRWSSLHTAGTARCTSLIEREETVRGRRRSAPEKNPGGTVLTNAAVIAAFHQAGLELWRLESTRLVGHSHDHKYDLKVRRHSFKEHKSWTEGSDEGLNLTRRWRRKKEGDLLDPD